VADVALLAIDLLSVIGVLGLRGIDEQQGGDRNRQHREDSRHGSTPHQGN
jgi:hypothetical protein